MSKTIDDMFCDYLDALINGNRAAVIEAIADMNAAIDYEGKKPPRFSTILDRTLERGRPGKSRFFWNPASYDPEIPERSGLGQVDPRKFQRCPTAADREQYASSRMSEVADRHAKRFYRDWIEHMPVRWRVLLSNDVFSGIIRRAMEELVGETRQEPVTPPTPAEIMDDLLRRRGIKRDS